MSLRKNLSMAEDLLWLCIRMMTQDPNSRTEVVAFCPMCRTKRSFRWQASPHAGWNLLLVVVTCGLWLPVWISKLFFTEMRPWRCLACGWHKPEFTMR